MKNILIVLGLILFIAPADAYTKTYTNRNPHSYNLIKKMNNSYRYQGYNYANRNLTSLRKKQNIRQAQKIKRLKKLRNNKFPNLTWSNWNKNGCLTGYSVPITQKEIYNQMGISPYNTFQRQSINQQNWGTNWFSMPFNYPMRNSSSEYYNGTSDIGSKAGVTIIYD